MESEIQESMSWAERSAKTPSSRPFASPVNFGAELSRYREFRAIRGSLLSVHDEEEEDVSQANIDSSDFSQFLCDEVMSGRGSEDGSKWNSVDDFKPVDSSRLSLVSIGILQNSTSEAVQNEAPYDKPRSASLLDIDIESDGTASRGSDEESDDPNTKASIQELRESLEDIGSNIDSEEALDDICRVMGVTNSHLGTTTSSHMLHSLLESSTATLIDTMTDEVEKVSKRVVHQFLR